MKNDIMRVFEGAPAGLTVKTLAAITGKSESTCRRAVHGLRRRKKIIEVGYTQWGATVYRIVEPYPWYRRLRDAALLRLQIYRIRLFGVRI